MSNPKENKKPVQLPPENVQTDMNFERMLKSFSRSVEKSGILQEIRLRRYYIKPSEIRHKLEGMLERKKVLRRRRQRRK